MKVIGDLKIKGQVQITGGKPGQDKILTSDPDGLATWETVVDLALQGEKGDKGDTGEKGDQGLQGDTGNTGAPGDEGIQGIKGDKGDQGDSFEYVDFTEEQLAGLKGDKGNTGDKGDTGPVDDKYINDVTFNANQLTITRNDNWSKTINLSGLDNSGLMGAADNDWTISGNNMYSIPTGNVGIGTTSPSEKLEINGWIGRTAWENGGLCGGYNNIGVSDKKTNPIFIVGGNYKPLATSLNNMFGIGYSHTNSTFITQGNEASWGMYVTSDGDARIFLGAAENGDSYFNTGGKFGIGTDTPTSKLHIKDYVNVGGDADYTILNLEHEFNDLGKQKVLIDFTLRDTNDNATPQVRIGAEVGENSDANSTLKEGSGGFVIYTAKGDSSTSNILTEKMRVDYMGNVGIGTTSPDAKLHVEGQVKITGGNPGPDKVLTSDGDGLATWKNHSGASNVGFFEVGMILPFAGNVLPVGWIECNGKVWWQDNYSTLYNVIGGTYNKGKSYPDQFLVPDLRGKSITGYDSGNSLFNQLGNIGGTEEETLSHTQIPHKAHTHTIDKGGSGHFHPIGWVHDGEAGLKTDGTGDGRAHHVLNAHAFKNINVFQNYVITGNHTFNDGEQVGCQSSLNVSDTPFQDKTQGEHSHSMSNGSASSNNNGSPHNNLPPYLTMKYMIYAGTYTEHSVSEGGDGN